jgi:AcrR family transcriptional regulator
VDDRLTQAERRARSRASLIEAARDVVARDGFHGATLEAIADHAGYSKGAVYWHFGSKDDLFLALFDAETRSYETRVHEAVAGSSASLPLVDLVVPDPEEFLIFIEFWTYAIRRPELRPKLAQRMTDLREIAAGAIGASPGPGRPDADALALLALAAARGLALEQLAAPEVIAESQIADFLERLPKALGG